jgi:hypothetical protein
VSAHLAAGLLGCAASLGLWGAGARGRTSVMRRYSQRVPDSWRSHPEVAAGLEWATAGTKFTRSYLRHLARWMVPIAVVSFGLAAIDFPAVVVLGTLAVYSVYAVGVGIPDDQREQRRWREGEGLPPPLRDRPLFLAYVGFRLAFVLGVLLFPGVLGYVLRQFV